MSEDTLSPITEHFAIIKSVTNRWAVPGISKVERYTDDLNKLDRSMSPCGKFYVYGTDYVFMSKCFPLTIPFYYAIEDEIDVCNRAINGIRNEAYKRMEMAIEIPKARITELLQLQHLQPEKESNVPPDSEYAEDLPDPDDSPMDEEFEAIQDRNMLDELIREDMLQPKSDEVPF